MEELTAISPQVISIIMLVSMILGLNEVGNMTLDCYFHNKTPAI